VLLPADASTSQRKMDVWTFATSSCQSDQPVVRARAGNMKPSSTSRTCAGGGFRLAPPARVRGEEAGFSAGVGFPSAPPTPNSSSHASRPGTTPERRTLVQKNDGSYQRFSAPDPAAQGFVAMSMKVRETRNPKPETLNPKPKP
jgi:hypothetical protein